MTRLLENIAVVVTGARAGIGVAAVRRCHEGGSLTLAARNSTTGGGEDGIHLNAVAPSLALNPFRSKVFQNAHVDQLAPQELLGRATEPSDVASASVFLAGDLASFVSGEVLSVSSHHP